MGEALIWGLFVFIVVFLINFLWIFKRGYENIKKQKSKKKNKDKDKKQGDWWIRQPPFTNFVGDFKVYFLNTEQKCL